MNPPSYLVYSPPGLLREPLVHFLLLGALLFGADALFSRGAEERRIAVTSAVREEVAKRWAREHGAPPNAAELEGAISRWIDDEILYREGLLRGLDQSDEAVRARVARKMLLVLSSRAILPEPSEAELRAFYESQRERYSDVARIDFTHVFVSGSDSRAEARAAELLDRLKSGASPNGLGDVFSGGRRYRGRAIADLAATFGDEFVEGIETRPIGAWTPARSRFGLHLVRIDRRTDPKSGDFASAREDVLHDWRDAARDRAVAEEMEKLRAAWVIVR